MNKPCVARATLFDLNPHKPHYYPYMVTLYRCNGSCITLDDPSGRICVLNITGYRNLNVCGMITKTNH